MDDEARRNRGPRPGHRSRDGGLAGVGGRLTASTAMVRTASRCYGDRRRRPMRRSISAPTIAGCWSRGRPATAFASSTRFPASSGSARASRRIGRISEAAIERAVEALGICRDKMRTRGVTRRATDRDRGLPRRRERRSFLARIAEEAGLDLEIVDRETEALLAATGCTPLIDPEARRRHPVRHRRRLLRARAARPLGAGRGAAAAAGDRRLGVAAGRRGDAGGALRRPHGVARNLRGHGRRSGGASSQHSPPRTACDSSTRFHLLGTSGTVTTIAGVHLDLKRYDRRRVDGCWMSDERGIDAWSSGCSP